MRGKGGQDDYIMTTSQEAENRIQEVARARYSPQGYVDMQPSLVTYFLQ